MNLPATQHETRDMEQCSAAPSRVIDYRDDPELWDAYVRSHPKGCVFHLSDMLEAFSATPKHEVFARMTVSDEGRVLALLAAVRVETLSGLASGFASRSIFYAEPICEFSNAGDAALRGLIAEHDGSMQRRTLFAEVRYIAAADWERQPLESAGYEFADYLNYEVDTRLASETLFRQLGKSTRNKIRRSDKRDIDILVDTSHGGIERMYPLVCTSYDRAGIPVVDIALFHETLDRLPAGSVQIRIARFEGQDVAAGIGLVFRGRFFAWYGGARRIQGLPPFDCLTWDEIRWCADHGMDCYDFGGAGWPEEEYGPRDFKAKFGGELVHYGRHRKVYRKLATTLAKQSFRIARYATAPLGRKAVR